MESRRLVTLGTLPGNVPVVADVTSLGSDVAVHVTLTQDYTLLMPENPFSLGFPLRPCFTGAQQPQYPHTIPAGIALALLGCEATALVAAGGAVLT